MINPSVGSYINNDINTRNINKVLHFTNQKNVNNILSYGLKSINLLKFENSDYYFNDLYRHDNRYDYISLSISFPNNKMFYKYRMENPNEQFVVLEISPDVIVSKDCLFFYTNAACSQFSTQSNELFQTKEAWDSLFSKKDRNPNLPDHLTTDVQAELMIKDFIEPEFIQKIHLSGKKNPNLPNNLSYELYSDMFLYRKEDYL